MVLFLGGIDRVSPWCDVSFRRLSLASIRWLDAPRWNPPPIVAPFPPASGNVHSPHTAPKIRPVMNHPSQMSAATTQICRWTWKAPRLAPLPRPRGGIRTVPSSHRSKGSSSSPTAKGNRPLRQLVNVGAHTAAQSPPSPVHRQCPQKPY